VSLRATPRSVRPGGSRRQRAATVVALLVLSAFPAQSTAALDGHRTAVVQPVGDLLEPDPAPGVGLSRAVAAVPLVSAELASARSALQAMSERRDIDKSRIESILPTLALLDDEAGSLDRIVQRRDSQVARAEESYRKAHAAVREVAIEWFITGFGALEGLDPALTGSERQELSRRFMLSRHAAAVAMEGELHLRSRLATLQAERDSLAGQRDERRSSADVLREELEQRTKSVDEADRRLPGLEQRVEQAALGASVAGTDLSATALDAYWRADRTLAAIDPRCGVTWWVLAGIGRTESEHGTYRGSRLGIDGNVSPPVFGPYLDGSNERFAVIPDSDGGMLDGTSMTDRAVGPMQFLPGTWRMVGTDGDGDGVADPQNLFDAAVSAGVYLCRSGPGLADDSRLRAALLTYNRSLEYVEVVLQRGRGYQLALDLGR
jgi:membrane-bound lytic murein transglycosylase B